MLTKVTLTHRLTVFVWLLIYCCYQCTSYCNAVMQSYRGKIFTYPMFLQKEVAVVSPPAFFCMDVICKHWPHINRICETCSEFSHLTAMKPCCLCSKPKPMVSSVRSFYLSLVFQCQFKFHFTFHILQCSPQHTLHWNSPGVFSGLSIRTCIRLLSIISSGPGRLKENRNHPPHVIVSGNIDTWGQFHWLFVSNLTVEME